VIGRRIITAQIKFHSRAADYLKEWRKSNSCLPRRRSGFLQEKSQNQRNDDPVEQWFETGLVVSQRKIAIAFGHLQVALRIPGQVMR